MKVLLVTGEFPPQPGGVGDYSDRLAGALSDQGHVVGVLTSPPDTVDSVAAGDAVWANREGATVWRAIGRWNLRAWRTLAAQIRSWRPDVVHVQYQAGAFDLSGAVTLYPWLLRSWNIRPLSVVTFHDLLTPHLFPLAGRLGWDRRVVAWLARGADAAIATNADDARRLVTLRARRVWQVPIGANIPVRAAPSARAEVRRRHNLEPEAPLLGYFGFYNAEKGLEELLIAFAGLLQQRPDARLLLIGGSLHHAGSTDAPFARRLQQRAAELAIADRLIWTGYVDAAGVSTYLQAADVIVLPFRDGVSLRRGTLMAALSHGCAVVSTTPAAPVAELEEAVLLCRTNDPADLQRAMDESLQPAQQARLRPAAQAVARHFAWGTIAEAHTAIYRALCHDDT